jgi:hypothetical protein
MTESPDPQDPLGAQNEPFFEKIERALRDLFERAKAQNELHFACSLNPEFRGEQGPGWSTADDVHSAFDEYLAFLREGEFTSLKARVALAFYCPPAEASGYYEIPKNMLRVVGGQPYNLWPFQDLVETHRKTGAVVSPNANKVLRDLAGHAATLGLSELAEVFRDAFDPDIRNAYAHADYVIWKDGLRLRKRNGGFPRKVPWSEFQSRFDRGINLFYLAPRNSERVRHLVPPSQTISSTDGRQPTGASVDHPVRSGEEDVWDFGWARLSRLTAGWIGPARRRPLSLSVRPSSTGVERRHLVVVDEGWSRLPEHWCCAFRQA